MQRHRGVGERRRAASFLHLCAASELGKWWRIPWNIPEHWRDGASGSPCQRLLDNANPRWPYEPSHMPLQSVDAVTRHLLLSRRNQGRGGASRDIPRTSLYSMLLRDTSPGGLSCRERSFHAISSTRRPTTEPGNPHRLLSTTSLLSSKYHAMALQPWSSAWWHEQQGRARGPPKPRFRG